MLNRMSGFTSKKRIALAALIFAVLLSASFGWSEKNIGALSSVDGAKESIYNEVHATPIRAVLSTRRAAACEREGLHGNVLCLIPGRGILFCSVFSGNLALNLTIFFIFFSVISFIHAKDGKKRVHPFS